MVNAEGIWPLEFTCRFGYPGSAILQSLQLSSWAEIFEALLEDGERFETRQGFSVGVVVTVPPFPYTRIQIAEPVGVPVRFLPPLSEKQLQHVHLGEVKREGSMLVTAGIYGWTMVVTGLGDSITAAQQQAYGLLDKLVLANCRYRLDIGNGVQDADLALIDELGLFG
jgi:phosphoribosylamine--glycine ligase